MKLILVLPTFIIVRCIVPFLPKEHLWYKKKFTLKDYAQKSTDANMAFSFFFWITGLFMLQLAIKLFL